MLKLKAPLIIAGATCILSMLIGLISGVRFLNILGRGLIAGIGAGGFVLCARMVLDRFIPDLFVLPVSSEAVETADISSGANINITLDDDLGGAAAVTVGGNAETSGMPNTAGAQTEVQNTVAASVTGSPNDSDSSDIGANTGLSDSSSLPLNGSPQGNSGLSDLPNMGSFIDDDKDNDFDENIAVGVQTDSSSFSMSGIQTSDTDTKVMAQAIRTVLATED